MDTQEQRRLLELAAKAIGGRITQWDGGTIFHPKTGHAFDWCPIDDDGDALRLAVKLGLAVRVLEKCVFVESDPETLLGQSSVSELEMYGNSDPYAATRLAIVRAAAAIGEMEEQK